MAEVWIYVCMEDGDWFRHVPEIHKYALVWVIAKVPLRPIDDLRDDSTRFQNKYYRLKHLKDSTTHYISTEVIEDKVKELTAKK